MNAQEVYIFDKYGKKISLYSSARLRRKELKAAIIDILEDFSEHEIYYANGDNVEILDYYNYE